MVPHLGHTELIVVVVVTGLKKQTEKRFKVIGQRFIYNMPLIGLELTFAGLHTFRPTVINIFIAKCSTVLEPSATRSTATDSA